MSLTQEEIRLLQILRDVVAWAASYLGWTARDYQEKILRKAVTSKQVVLRLGRRLGKTEMMCILILYYAITQINKDPNAPRDEFGKSKYDILIVTPYEAQIDLIFKRLHELIDLSPVLKSSIRRDVHHQIQLNNGSSIKGMTAGTKSGTGAAATRGQRADLIILDEVDYASEDDISNLLNIRNEAPDRIRIISASTPSGRRGSFYRWCTGTDSNGWTHFHASSDVNPELLKINTDTGKTYLQELKEELPEIRYIQEVLAEFGDEQGGVYAKRHLDAAKQLGKDLGYVKYPLTAPPKKGPRALGVDWDKFQAGPNLVGLEFSHEHSKYIPIFRKEIPRTQFSLDNAVQEIIKSNEIWNWDVIVLDRGYGEYQVETLRKYGMTHPDSGLANKIISISLSDKVKVRDPVTRRIEKKPIKPFMVNNSVLIFERGNFIMNPFDRDMIKQFEDYRVVSISITGAPTYVDFNEHIVDATNFALYGLQVRFGDMLKVTVGRKVAAMPSLFGEDNVKSRDIPEPQQKIRFPGLGLGVILSGSAPRGGRGGFGGTPSRRTF